MMVCSECGSTNINFEEKEGRGLPPRNYTRHPRGAKISWKGVWNIYTCRDCGKTWKKLKR